MCYTFYSDGGSPCYQTIGEEGWVSGTPNCNTKADEIKDLASIPGTATPTTFSYGPFGNLFSFPGQQNYFHDKPIGAVTAVNMWVGNYTNNGITTADVIVGIQFEYLQTLGQVHGSKNGKLTTCKASPIFTAITVNSLEDPSDFPYTSLIYFLKFESNQKTCSAGISGRAPSKTIPNTNEGKSPIYIYGNTLDTTDAYPYKMLKNLYFKYQ